MTAREFLTGFIDANKDVDLIMVRVSGSYRIARIPADRQGQLNWMDAEAILDAAINAAKEGEKT